MKEVVGIEVDYNVSGGDEKMTFSVFSMFPVSGNDENPFF
jgi:hypothetical protein